MDQRIAQVDRRLPQLFKEYGGYAINFENLGWEEFSAMGEIILVLTVFFTILPVLEIL